MKKLIKYLAIPSLSLYALLVAVMPVSAAVDSDLTTALASSTALVNDNKSAIITFFSGLVALVVIIGLAKIALMMGKKWIGKAFGG